MSTYHFRKGATWVLVDGKRFYKLVLVTGGDRVWFRAKDADNISNAFRVNDGVHSSSSSGNSIRSVYIDRCQFYTTQEVLHTAECGIAMAKR